MSNINITLTGTDIVAWWGAIVATSVFIWEIYKWRTSGPRIKFAVQPNSLVVGDPVREGKKFISVNATNVGDRPTTITNLVLQHYKNYFNMLRRKPSISMVVLKPSTSQPIPYILQPGGVWQGLVPQDSELEDLSKDGHLVCGLCHSHSDKEIDRRVILKSNNKA